MSVLAVATYIGAIVAFATIFVTESHKSTTETLIMTTDNTGQDGYTCTMISKVTASYEIVSDGPYGSASQAFQLINVIESKAQYQADYAIADPCSQPLVFFPGTPSMPYATQDVTWGGAALYMEDTAVLAIKLSVPTILTMNYTSGQLQTYGIRAKLLIGSIAVDTDANPIFLASDAPSVYRIYRFSVHLDSFTGEELLYTTTLPNQPIILNDNLYNIYLAEHDTFTALDVYSNSNGSASNTTLFTTRDGEYITYAAVYNSGSSIKVYYVNNTDGVNVWEGGVFTGLSGQGSCVGITVDGFDNLYYLFFYAGESQLQKCSAFLTAQFLALIALLLCLTLYFVARLCCCSDAKQRNGVHYSDLHHFRSIGLRGHSHWCQSDHCERRAQSRLRLQPN
jgi:hypothetical protein